MINEEFEDPGFNAMDWELYLAGTAAGRDEYMLNLGGILTRMADENGFISADPDDYPDDPECQAIAAILASECAPGEKGFRLTLPIPEG